MIDDPPPAAADPPPELPTWERDLGERVVRWARGADRPGHPSRRDRTTEDGTT